MPLRFKLMSSLFVIVLLMATDNGNRPFGDVFDVFAGLAVFLVLSLASIFPNWSLTDRVDRSLDGGSWADKIDIEASARQSDRSIRR